MRRHSLIVSCGLVALGSVVACGGGAGPAARTVVPGTRNASEVQAAAIKESYVGKTKCDPKHHDRPFVIEWDATDSSSFEARAKSDVLFVKYEGCELTILDNCRNDSTPGAYGSYRAPEWTSGSVEVMEIANEGDLFAKLPLGVGTLGGRVQGGEHFRMEYFVSGTRHATRDRIYRSDLQALPGCREATHFVYGYNLGAFALGSSSNLKGEVGGSVWGIGAGASKSQASKAEKTGGLLSSCRAESAKETETCKTPIRLSLREISDGDNPDAVAMQMPDTPSAKNLAGKLKAQTDREKAAEEHLKQAMAKQKARDGKGCLSELDQHDKLDPRPSGLSTTPTNFFSQLRAQCVMLSGQCVAGKTALSKAMQAQFPDQGPSYHDAMVQTMTSMYCQGNDLSSDDKLRRAISELQSGTRDAKDAAYCRERIKTVADLMPSFRPKDEDDHTLMMAKLAFTSSGPGCLAKAGACDEAWSVYAKAEEADYNEKWKNLSPSSRQASVAMAMSKWVPTGFAAQFPRCKGKVQ
jgi:hypothetical protein